MSETPTPNTSAAELARRWTDLWNGSFEIADRLCANDFRVSFGANGDDGVHPADAVRTPADFVAFLREYHASRPGIQFELDGPAAAELDTEGDGRFAVRWRALLPDGAGRGGIDFFAVAHGAITRVWSVTAERLFPAT